MEIFNCATTKDNRRELRKNQTGVERRIWNLLRNKQVNGHKFFRQFGIGPYIVDFYCPILKIVIEIDGGQHYFEEEVKYDNRRTEFMKEAGIRVLRFSNLDVLKNLEGVFESIQNELP